MKWGFADVVRAPRLGFSAKKIWIAFLGILSATVVYSILTYVAYVTSGWTWKEVWREFRYIPWVIIPVKGVGTHLRPWSWVIWVIGVSAGVFILLTTVCAISKMTFEQLKGNEFYEVTEAIRFAIKQWKGTIGAPLVLTFLIGFLILVGFLCGLVGRIPYAGQIITGLLFIPIAFGALFVVYLAIVWFLSLIVSPAVTATTESDAFDTLFEVFSVLNDQTWRTVLWQIFIAFAAFAGVYILGWLVKKALILMHWALNLWSGTRYAELGAYRWWEVMWNNGLWYLPRCPRIPWAEILCAKVFHLPVLLWGVEWMKPLTWADWIGGFLAGLSFHFIGMFVAGYGLATWSAGQTLFYVVLVKIKDEKDLLEEKPEEELPIEEEEKKEEEKKEEKKEEEKKE